MRSLLDVNYLVALLDPQHAFHDAAHEVWPMIEGNGWASCPITEIGTIRVISGSKYPGSNKFSIPDLVTRLNGLTAQTDHEFWTEPVSIINDREFDPSMIVGSKQITDIYLLGLATYKKARLVTFDRKIPIGAVRAATESNLMVI